jgi:hypothetical protein
MFALAKFGANILFCPSPGLEIPPHVLEKLVIEYGGELHKNETPNTAGKDKVFPLDAIYMTPDSPHQLALIPSASFKTELKPGIDALYVTRAQKERFATTEGREEIEYPVVDKTLLKDKSFEKTIVMHPLPRVDELSYELDADPRSMYFKQAAHGVPVRMSLIALLLGAKEVPTAGEDQTLPGVEYPTYNRVGVKCPNPKCVSIQDTEVRYLKPDFKIVNHQPLTLRCVYCEHGTEPKYVASSDWHEGKINTKKYHRADSHWAKKIKQENLLIFDSETEAEDQGFKPDSFVKERQ